MSRSNLDTVVSVRFSAAEADRLRQKAAGNGVSVSNFIRQAALARLAPGRSTGSSVDSSTATGSQGSASIVLYGGASQVVQGEMEPVVQPI